MSEVTAISADEYYETMKAELAACNEAYNATNVTVEIMPLLVRMQDLRKSIAAYEQTASRIAELERALAAALEDNAAKVEAIAEARREWDSIITQNRAKDAEIARLRDALETARDSLMDIQDLSEPHKSYEGIGFQFDRIHTHATFGLSRSKDAAKLLEGKTL